MQCDMKYVVPDVNIRASISGSKAQYTGDAQNHARLDPHHSIPCTVYHIQDAICHIPSGIYSMPMCYIPFWDAYVDVVCWGPTSGLLARPSLGARRRRRRCRLASRARRPSAEAWHWFSYLRPEYKEGIL